MPLERSVPPVTVQLDAGDVLALLSDGIYEYENAHGEPFGAARVCSLIAAQHHRPMAEVGAALFAGVTAFAERAPQADDMTVVLVKREQPGARRTFARTLDSLAEIFAFTAETVPKAEVRRAVDLALEELFTNIVRHGRPGTSRVAIDIRRIGSAVRVTLADPDADDFDPRHAEPSQVIGQPVGGECGRQ